MKVLLSLLGALKERLSFSVTAVERNGRLVLARAPRPKADVSYFQLKNSGAAFQLVHGAEVLDRFQQTRAPDLCLQKTQATENPNHEDVLAIWDAKLRGETGEPERRRVTKSELAYFLLMMDALRVPRPGGDVAFLGSWPVAFQVSALISNGLRPTEPDSFFLEKGLSVVELFDGADSPGHPALERHLRYGAL